MPDSNRGDHGDRLDRQIRALVSRAVAEAREAPTPAEIDAAGDRRSHPTSSSEGSSHGPTTRVLLAVAASAAVVVLVLAAALAVGGLGGDSGPPRPEGPLAFRYVPVDLPPDLPLTSVESSPAVGLDPLPHVEVYEGRDDVKVRITVGPVEWAAGIPAAGGGATTVPATVVPETTTTIPPLGLPSVPGIPMRPRLTDAVVRGGPAGLDTHDATSSTVWFADAGRLVAVDVFGLDAPSALDLVDGLVPRPDGTGFDPGPDNQDLSLVAEAQAGPASAAARPTARLVFGGGALVVTNVQLTAGHDDLLAAKVGSFGSLEDLADGREVLIDDGLDGGATSQASFVDPEDGVLVTVQAPTGSLRRYLDHLERVDEQGWNRFVAAHPPPPTSPTTSPPTTSTIAPTTTVP